METVAKVATKSKAGLIIGIIAGVIVIGGGAAYFILRKKNAPATGGGTSGNTGGAGTGGSSTTTSTTTTTGGASSGGASAVVTAPTAKQPANLVNTTDPTLPNAGKGCGQIQTAHDGDYDYVLCSGTWYTRSKANPKTAKVKGTIPTWKSLGTNAQATQNLNVAYPQG